MNITFTARHFHSGEDLQKFAEDAAARLLEFFEGIVSADVVLEQEPHGDGKIAEISLIVARDKLFAKEKSNDFTASINACSLKLERQLRKYKERLHAGREPHEQPDFISPTEE